MTNCSDCGKEFRNPAHLARHTPRCHAFRNVRLAPEDTEQASHAAEDREARQRALGMLDGKGNMWWGDGRLM